MATVTSGSIPRQHLRQTWALFISNPTRIAFPFTPAIFPIESGLVPFSPRTLRIFIFPCKLVSSTACTD